ncbi:MAG: T9SS type A sorting domain-containing protein [Bacteroidota bacterium]
MKINKFLSIAGFAICTSAHSQNLIINGSFENNTATGNTLNLTTAWSSTVSDCFEVDGGSMDLITSNSCGVPSDGNWFVTCSPQNSLWPYLAFSFKLYAPIIAGASYTLTFDKRYCGPNSSPIDIGISDDSTMLGTFIHTFAAPLVNTWATETYIFQALSAAKYLTVNVGVSGGTGTIGLDNFSLQSIVTGIYTFADEKLKLFFNPSNKILTASFPKIASEKEITIYNAIGASVYQSSIIPIESEQKSEIDLSALTKGIYIVCLLADDNEINYSEKIMIR